MGYDSIDTATQQPFAQKMCMGDAAAIHDVSPWLDIDCPIDPQASERCVVIQVEDES
jgi:hypothetical protein